MDIPKEIEKWLIYDEDNFEYIIDEKAPKEIKQKYEKLLNDIDDFKIIDN